MEVNPKSIREVLLELDKTNKYNISHLNVYQWLAGAGYIIMTPYNRIKKNWIGPDGVQIFEEEQGPFFDIRITLFGRREIHNIKFPGTSFFPPIILEIN